MGSDPIQASPLVCVLTRDVVVASGPEAAGYLQGQLSQDVEALPVGGSARSFVLQPQGKVDAWLRVTRTGDDRFVLDVDAGWGHHLLARLQRFKLRTKVDLEPATWSLAAVRGDGAAVAAEAIEGAFVVADAGWPGVEGADVLGPDLGANGLGVLAPADLEEMRIRAGVPAMGAEVTEATIPAELGQRIVDESVSFTKGCYTGQELVARIDSRGGHVPRPVRGLLLDTPTPPPPGTVVRAGGSDKPVGHVTSSAAGASGGAVALAVVGRAVEPGSLVRLGELDPAPTATVVGLPVGA